MTLIDKEALLEKLSTFHPDYTFNITSFRNFIKAQPAVDAIPVIRCKECKYNINNPVSYYDDDPIMTYAWCNTECFDENGFCSCGKRRDNG